MQNAEFHKQRNRLESDNNRKIRSTGNSKDSYSGGGGRDCMVRGHLDLLCQWLSLLSVHCHLGLVSATRASLCRVRVPGHLLRRFRVV